MRWLSTFDFSLTGYFSCNKSMLGWGLHLGWNLQREPLWIMIAEAGYLTGPMPFPSSNQQRPGVVDKFLYRRFNSHFPGGPGLAGTRMSPCWILLDLRMMEMVKQSFSQNVNINKPTSSFLQARCPSCHPANSVKALEGNGYNNNNNNNNSNRISIAPYGRNFRGTGR